MKPPDMTHDKLAEYKSKHAPDPELEARSYKNDECFINTPWLDHKTVKKEYSEKFNKLLIETKKELERINAKFNTR